MLKELIVDKINKKQKKGNYKKYEKNDIEGKKRNSIVALVITVILLLILAGI